MSFRFHLVSLVAVFLALALGIGMGATVIDKATVESLKRRVVSVEATNTAVNQRVDVLNAQINRDRAYQERISPYATAKALTGVPVVIITWKGIDQSLQTDIRKSLTDASADVLGTISLTPKIALNDAKSVEQARQLLTSSATEPSQLQQILLARISSVLAGSSTPDALGGLVNAGFVEWDGTRGATVESVSFASARIVMLSTESPPVANDAVMIPLARLFAVQPTRRVVVVEPGRDADPTKNQNASRAVFVDLIRNDTELKKSVSTVDNIEMPEGRVGAILALVELANGKVGSYGVASSAEGLIPKAGS